MPHYIFTLFLIVYPVPLLVVSFTGDVVVVVVVVVKVTKIAFKNGVF